MDRDPSDGNATQAAAGSSAVALQHLYDSKYPQLRSQWRRLFRSPAPKRISAAMLLLGVAWKLQERMRGGHGRRVKGQLDRLAEAVANGEAVAPVQAVTLKIGARLVREWRGETHDVIVTEDGFRWRGEIWPSLSSIAREITGTRWSGPRFFGVAPSGRRGALDTSSKASRSGGVGDGKIV